MEMVEELPKKSEWDNKESSSNKVWPEVVSEDKSSDGKDSLKELEKENTKKKQEALKYKGRHLPAPPYYKERTRKKITT